MSRRFDSRDRIIKGSWAGWSDFLSETGTFECGALSALGESHRQHEFAANQPVFFRRGLVFLGSLAIVRPSRASLQNGSEFHQRKRLWQGLAVRLQRFDPLFDDLAEFDEDFRCIIAMAPAIEQLWTTADKAVVFVRPLDHLHVSVAFRHWFTSLRALRTAFSRYRCASSPSLPDIVTKVATFG